MTHTESKNRIGKKHRRYITHRPLKLKEQNSKDNNITKIWMILRRDNAPRKSNPQLLSREIKEV